VDGVGDGSDHPRCWGLRARPSAAAPDRCPRVRRQPPWHRALPRWHLLTGVLPAVPGVRQSWVDASCFSVAWKEVCAPFFFQGGQTQGCAACWREGSHRQFLLSLPGSLLCAVAHFQGCFRGLGKAAPLGILALDFPCLPLCHLFAFLRARLCAQPRVFLEVCLIYMNGSQKVHLKSSFSSWEQPGTTSV